MATTKKKVQSTNVVFTLDLDSFTWGELEDMESNSPTKIRETMQKFARIKGVEGEDAMTKFLRGLSLNQMKEFSEQFQEAVAEATNPVGKNGKN